MELLPRVSVVVLNYNGRQYLPPCLDALEEQTYPRSRFEVIVSDNGSTDRSLDLLRTRYPYVRTLENQENLGFSAGNNVAIRKSQGKYVVLLNNDTRPHPSWLESLVAVAEANPDAGMVTSRIQLLYDQLEMSLKVLDGNPPHLRDEAVKVRGVTTGLDRAVVQYLEGFGPWMEDESGRYRLMKADASLGVPVPPHSRRWEVALRFALVEHAQAPVRLAAGVGSIKLAEWVISKAEPAAYRLSLPDDVRDRARPLVQNAGSVVFSNGSGRDRGTFVCRSEVFYEEDNGQYGQVEEVAAGCGAALLMRRDMLDDVGLLDESFFMYYEDTDLSLRARRKGWKILYAPGAIVRHVHCGTSEEWSPHFVYLTDRNRLAMLLKNGSPYQIWQSWRDYLAETVRASIRAVRVLLARQNGWRAYLNQALINLKVISTLVARSPNLARKRWRIQRTARVALARLQEWFQEPRGANECG